MLLNNNLTYKNVNGTSELERFKIPMLLHVCCRLYSIEPCIYFCSTSEMKNLRSPVIRCRKFVVRVRIGISQSLLRYVFLVFRKSLGFTSYTIPLSVSFWMFLYILRWRFQKRSKIIVSTIPNFYFVIFLPSQIINGDVEICLFLFF